MVKCGHLWPRSQQRDRSQSGLCIVWFWASSPGHITSVLFYNLTLQSNSLSVFEQRTFDFLSLCCLFSCNSFCTECQLPFLLMLNFCSYFQALFKCHVLWKPQFIRQLLTALLVHSMTCMPPVERCSLEITIAFVFWAMSSR